jgi:hypothetical protein
MENENNLNNNESNIENLPNPEEAFEYIMMTDLLKVYSDAFSEVGFTKEQIHDFKKEMGDLSQGDRRKVMSYPHELRKRVFGYYLDELKKGTLDGMGDVIKDILNDANKNGWDIGYHTSPNKIDIVHKKDKFRKDIESWMIKGTENDHRDSNLPMAYYSKNYKDIYRQRKFNYVYVVKSSLDDRVGDDGKWYRASTLAVVARIDMDSVDVDDIYRKYKEYIEMNKYNDNV